MYNTIFKTFNFDVEFDYKLNYIVGVEVEITLPFNQNKWTLYIEPSYQYYKANKEITSYESGVFINTTTVFIDYNSILFPIGFKYNMFISKYSKNEISL